MAHAAHGGSALGDKTKELVALAISVATRCAPRIAYHAEGTVALFAAPRHSRWAAMPQ